MQIDPLYTLPLVYELTDPFDSNTYYVRAVIRDSLLGTVLSTTNLALQSTGRYFASVQAPADPTGQGRHIDVTISVYTDSGYSVYSDVYQKKIDKYLIKRISPNFGGTGGGVDVDYDKIRKIILEIITKQLAEIKFPATDLTDVYAFLAKIMKKVASIEIPEPTPQIPVNLTPIQASIESAKAEIASKIEAIDIPEQKEPDFSPVISALQEVKTLLESVDTSVQSDRPEIIKSVQKIIAEMLATNDARVQKMNEMLTGALQANNALPPAPVEKPKPLNPELNKYFPAQQ